ncbi:hypothetical protein BG000_003790 [Podila horticola]|nr:hypothetical protein BG000_003790 [Podila horticola]
MHRLESLHEAKFLLNELLLRSYKHMVQPEAILDGYGWKPLDQWKASDWSQFAQDHVALHRNVLHKNGEIVAAELEPPFGSLMSRSSKVS